MASITTSSTNSPSGKNSSNNTTELLLIPSALNGSFEKSSTSSQTSVTSDSFVDKFSPPLYNRNNSTETSDNTSHSLTKTQLQYNSNLETEEVTTSNFLKMSPLNLSTSPSSSRTNNDAKEKSSGKKENTDSAAQVRRKEESDEMEEDEEEQFSTRSTLIQNEDDVENEIEGDLASISESSQSYSHNLTENTFFTPSSSLHNLVMNCETENLNQEKKELDLVPEQEQDSLRILSTNTEINGNNSDVTEEIGFSLESPNSSYQSVDSDNKNIQLSPMSESLESNTSKDDDYISSGTYNELTNSQKENLLQPGNYNAKPTKKKMWYHVFTPSYKSRVGDFKKNFKDLPTEERLIVDYSCAIQKDILVQGRLFVSQNYLCFHANIFGWETHTVIRLKEVTSITKEKTALVIPNAIQVSTDNEKYFFTSFVTRDSAYVMLFKLWQSSLLDHGLSPKEIWKLVRASYGDELGIASEIETEDYLSISPSTLVKAASISTLISSTSEADDNKSIQIDLVTMPSSNSSSSSTSSNGKETQDVVTRRNKVDRHSLQTPIQEVRENVTFIPNNSTKRPLSEMSTFNVHYNNSDSSADSPKSRPPFRTIQSSPIFNQNILSPNGRMLKDENANEHRSRKSSSVEPPTRPRQLSADNGERSRSRSSTEPPNSPKILSFRRQNASSTESPRTLLSEKSTDLENSRRFTYSESSTPSTPTYKNTSDKVDDSAQNCEALVDPSQLDKREVLTNGVRRRTELSDDTTDSETELENRSGEKDRLPVVIPQCTVDHTEGKELVNAVIPCDVDTLFTMLFTNSKFYLDFHTSRKTFDIVQSEWEESPTDEAKKVRQVSFTVTLNQMMGPKHSQLSDTQTMLPVSKPGLLYAIDCEAFNSGIPYADAFYVTSHYCLSRVSAHQSNLVIICQIKYKKSVFVKGFIERSSWAGMTEFYNHLERALKEECLKSNVSPPVSPRIGGVSTGPVRRMPRKKYPAPGIPGEASAIKVRTGSLNRNAVSPGASAMIEADISPSLLSEGSFLLKVILTILAGLLIINAFLYVKLAHLETSASTPAIFPTPKFSLPEETPQTHQEWLSLLQKQEFLHRLELQKWHDILLSALKVLKQAETDLEALKFHVATYSEGYGKILKETPMFQETSGNNENSDSNHKVELK